MITDIRNLIAARRDEENDEGGFTLIELLIVIVVLGILAAIVVFAVQNLTGESAASACKSDAKSVEVATEAYKAQMNANPANVAALTATQTAPGGATVGPWLRSAPNATRYVVTTNAGVVEVTGTQTPPAGPFDINTVPDACAQATA